MSIIKTPITIALTVLLLLGVGYVSWKYFNQEKSPRRPLNSFEYLLVQKSAAHFAEELESIEGLYDLVILPIRERRKRNIPEMFAEYLSDYTRINVRPMEEIYDLVKEKKEEIEKEEERALFDEEKFLTELFLRREGYGVLKLLVRDFRAGRRGKGAGLHLEGHLKLRGEDGKIHSYSVKPFRRYIKTEFSLLYYSAWIRSFSPLFRMFLWLIFVALLPLGTSSLVVKIARYQSNKYNFLMILGYTAVDMFFAYALVGFVIYSTWTELLFFLGFLASGIYNYEICDFIEEWS